VWLKQLIDDNNFSLANRTESGVKRGFKFDQKSMSSKGIDMCKQLGIEPSKLGLPDLLHHKLGKDERFNNGAFETLCAEIEDGRPVIVSAASGSGKTRTMLECMQRMFAYYFTCSTDLNGGSADLEKMLERLHNRFDHTYTAEDAIAASLSVYDGFRSLVSLRKLVFVALAIKYNNIGAAHWLQVQYEPAFYFGEDLFARLALFTSDIVPCVDNLDSIDLADLFGVDADVVQRIVALFPSHNNVLNLPIFIDEAQMLIDKVKSRCLPAKFFIDKLKGLLNPADVTNERRAALTPILSTSCNNYQLVLAGTYIDLPEIARVCASIAFKQIFKETDYYFFTLGSFIEENDFMSYMTSICSTSDSLPYIKQLHDRLPYLHERLKGRFRITAAFLSNYLMHPDRGVERALNETRNRMYESINKSKFSTLPKLVYDELVIMSLNYFFSAHKVLQIHKLISVGEFTTILQDRQRPDYTEEMFQSDLQKLTNEYAIPALLIHRALALVIEKPKTTGNERERLVTVFQEPLITDLIFYRMREMKEIPFFDLQEKIMQMLQCSSSQAANGYVACYATSLSIVLK
jgi:hypothetical protein